MRAAGSGLSLVLCLTAGTAGAQSCRIQTAGSACVTVPDAQRYVAPYAVGDTLPRGDYLVLFNATYCGLPSARDGWGYFRVERDVMRVEFASMTVLEVVTGDLARTCR